MENLLVGASTLPDPPSALESEPQSWPIFDGTLNRINGADLKHDLLTVLGRPYANRRVCEETSRQSWAAWKSGFFLIDSSVTRVSASRCSPVVYELPPAL